MKKIILTIPFFLCFTILFSQEPQSTGKKRYIPLSDLLGNKKHANEQSFFNHEEFYDEVGRTMSQGIDQELLKQEEQRKKEKELEEAFNNDITNYYSQSGTGAIPANEYNAIAQQHSKQQVLPVSKQSVYPDSELRVKKNISIFEAFFQGLGSTILGILFITLIIGTLRILSSRKTSTNQIKNNEKMILPEDLENELTINIRSTEKKDKINYNEIIKNKLADLRQVFNNRITRISKKIKTLNYSEIIIVSVAVGAIFFLILGYGFADKERFVYHKGEKYYLSKDETYSDIETTTKLNYGLAFPSFIITAGICYLFLNSKKKVQKNNNDNYEI